MAASDGPWTIPEFAALCREKCGKPAQSDDGRMCGDEGLADGEPSYTFCGFHMAAAIGSDDFEWEEHV